MTQDSLKGIVRVMKHLVRGRCASDFAGRNDAVFCLFAFPFFQKYSTGSRFLVFPTKPTSASFDERRIFSTSTLHSITTKLPSYPYPASPSGCRGFLKPSRTTTSAHSPPCRIFPPHRTPGHSAGKAASSGSSTSTERHITLRLRPR